MVMSPEIFNGATAVLAGVDGSTPFPEPHSMVDSRVRVAGVRPTAGTEAMTTVRNGIPTAAPLTAGGPEMVPVL